MGGGSVDRSKHVPNRNSAEVLRLLSKLPLRPSPDGRVAMDATFDSARPAAVGMATKSKATCVWGMSGSSSVGEA